MPGGSHTTPTGGLLVVRLGRHPMDGFSAEGAISLGSCGHTGSAGVLIWTDGWSAASLKPVDLTVVPRRIWCARGAPAR
ncbi:hypothetical protein ACFV2L_41985 [Streptomyces sp. NPDC059687]|uniref:hypothetical protein n=1 Tax=Streptomyces TaxID=1883 RepID=UPI0031ED0DAB